MRARLSLIVLLFAAACASGTGGTNRPENVAQPVVQISRSGALFFGSGDTAPLTLNVRISNEANDALIVRQIELTSPGMMQYMIEPVRRPYGDRLGPGEAKTFLIGTRAVTNEVRLQASEPLTVRAIVDFEHEGRRFREIYLVSVEE